MPLLPYLTAEFPGTGGRIKEHVEDFRVEEIPLYPFSGEGTHAYFRVTKAGLPTPTAVNRIARHMGVRPTDIGVAGLKDAQAVTSQWMSLEHIDKKRLRHFNNSQIRIDEITYHTNKLRPGLLAGNRFVIRIRGVQTKKLETAQAILNVLKQRGVPNFFGQQRFGARGDTGDLGAAMVADKLDEFVAIFLGRPISNDPPDCKAAREAFDADDYERALQLWPRHYSDQRRALVAYKRKRRPGAAVAAVDKRLKRLFVSAFQSDLFNAILVRRLQSLDRVWPGDLAEKTDTGGIFTVENAAIEQSRADRFEISPTGPIFGYRSSLAKGDMGEIEQAVLSQSGATLEDFRHVGTLKVKGSRRVLRFKIDELNLSAGTDKYGKFLQVNFTAPSGAYATVALREIMKT